MTFQVFVGYGDAYAKEVAENLGYYLRRFGMDAFVASTDPAWMLPGQSIAQILEKLRNSAILIAVCTGNTPNTSKLAGEIQYARANNMPILPFVERGINPPFDLQNIWFLDFDLNSPWAQHRKIGIYILWLMERSLEALTQRQIT
jgi:hypothetical protein